LLAAARQGLNFCNIHGGKKTHTQTSTGVAEEKKIRDR
jgi:hypothetical protein